MAAVTQHKSIYDLAKPQHGVEIGGEMIRIVKLGPSKMVPLLERFPEMTQIEQLEFGADGDIDMSTIDAEKLGQLARLVAFQNAMCAAALGHLNDADVEAMVDEHFDDDQKTAIITAAQNLATGKADEGFSKRSA